MREFVDLLDELSDILDEIQSKESRPLRRPSSTFIELDFNKLNHEFKDVEIERDHICDFEVNFN